MSTYVKLQKQIEALQAEAAKILSDEKAGKIAEVKAIIQTYSLTPQEVFGRSGNWKGKGSTPKANRSALFGDANGNTWGGRGPRPQWLRDALNNGSNLDDFKLQGKPLQAEAAKTRRAPAKKAAAAKRVPRVGKAPARKRATKKPAAAGGAAPRSE